MLQSINLEEKLVKIREKSLKNTDILQWAKSILSELEANRMKTLSRLKKSENDTINIFDIDKVDTNTIFHISQIEKLCVNYRLRFLDTKYFKGEYPSEVISKITDLERTHNIKLDGFKIVAPSVLFKLKKADDPILFAPMGNGYYYLIHKWGNDLHPFRKFKYWGVKNVGTFAVSLMLISAILTLLTHTFFFQKHTNFIYAFLLFLFYFKGAVGLGLYFGISSGKNFTEYCWQSKYDKIC